MKFLKKIFIGASSKVAAIQNFNSLSDNYKSYNNGIELFIRKKWEDALYNFDEAIKNGSYKPDIFVNRGICLQELCYHFEAIDDFNKAIPFFPDDCNLYFMRSVSYHATANPIEAYIDIQKAIQLSKSQIKKNKLYDIAAIDMGYKSTTMMYEARENSMKISLKRLQDYEQQLKNSTSTEENYKIRQNKKNWQSLFLSSVKYRK